MRASGIAGAALAVCLVAGCGSTTKTETTTVSVPATTTPVAETTPTTTPTAEVPETTTPSSGSDSSRQDPITVRGRTGDALTLLGQYATTLSGTPKKRSKVKVTLKGMRGPFSGFDLAKGHKLIGFDLHVANVGDKRYDDPLPSGTLILVGGENGKPTNLIPGSGANPCDNPSLKLKPGQSKDVCIAFDVPTKAKLQTLQYETDSGFGDTALWRLR